MLFHTRGMSRREQAVALVNSLFWPELVEVRAHATRDAAAYCRDHWMAWNSATCSHFPMPIIKNDGATLPHIGLAYAEWIVRKMKPDSGTKAG